MVAEPQVWLIGIELSTDKALEKEKKLGAGGGGRAVKWSAIKTYIAKTLKAKAQCYHRSNPLGFAVFYL